MTTKRSLGLAAALLAASLILPGALRAGEPAKAAAVDHKAAFEKLKGLAGEWQGTVAATDGPAANVRYAVTAGGNAVVETLFPGTDHEMVTVYHLEDGRLAATHYCSSGNQPHFRLDPEASTADTLVFAFDGGTSFDPAKDGHIHSGRIAWKGENSLESEWAFYQGGKQAESNKFLLRR